MTTDRYRTGHHWGVTIVRDGPGPEDVMGHHSGDELVAVIVNGDQVLAERVCRLLNADADSARARAPQTAENAPLVARDTPEASGGLDSRSGGGR